VLLTRGPRSSISGDEVSNPAAGPDQACVATAIEVNGGKRERMASGEQARAAPIKRLVRHIRDHGRHNRNSDDGQNVRQAGRFSARGLSLIFWQRHDPRSDGDECRSNAKRRVAADNTPSAQDILFYESISAAR
jgi:hypothetical protein